jgi:hypothetical protein
MAAIPKDDGANHKRLTRFWGAGMSVGVVD